MRLSATLRPVTRLTGSLGVATITTFGDATALVTDILAPKTAYIATGKVTGTCTFDADTSDADAVESDILLGKTAYAGGTKLTGTNQNNANTSSADIVANDLLYGKKGYGAAGTEITGTGAYWQYVKYMICGNGQTFFGNVVVPSNLILYMPNCVYITSLIGGENTSVTRLEVTVSDSISRMDYAFCNASSNEGPPNLTEIVLHGDVSHVIRFTYAFRGNKLETIGGDALNVSSAVWAFGFDTMFVALPALKNIAFVAGTIKDNVTFIGSPLLTTASLLSIANGLDAAAASKTLKMHATAKTNMLALMVDDVAGVAVAGNTMTLTAFIQNTKGWTVA